MTAIAHEPPAVARRANVLAYPSPTTSRFIVFLAALLAAGAFIGTWVHGQVLGDQWLSNVGRCQQQSAAATTAGGLSGELQRHAAEEDCRASVERRRAAFSFGGAVVAGGTGLLVLFLVPRTIERRRRLRRLPPALVGAEERAGQLARAMGLERTPTLMLGPSVLRDAFSYGTPGRYRIALPPAAAVRWRDQSLFDPLIDHELAHIKHRDVPLAWLARSVWYALAPLLALPIVVSVFSGDLSLMPDYIWRAVLLAVTVQLTSNALLRSREHDADLRAAQADGGLERVTALLARSRDAGPQPRWRRALANHPSPGDRVAVLERPPLAARVTLVDGLTTGFLAGLSVPVLVSLVNTFLIGSGHADHAWLFAACLAGPLLAGSIGLGLSRAALLGRVEGVSASPARPALGVAVGLILGEAGSFEHTGVGPASLHPLAWLPLLGLLGGATTVLAGGVAELLADAAPAVRSKRTSWVLALIVMALLFSATLWIGTALETPLALGWRGVEAWLVTSLKSWLVLSAFGAVALAVLWSAWTGRRPRVTPGWILERGEPASWPTGDRRDVVRALRTGLIAGVAIGGAIAVDRAIEGPADTDALAEQRLYLFVWMCAAAGLAGALPVAASTARRGAALAVPAGLVACLVAVACWLAVNTALGGSLSWTFIRALAELPLGMSFAAVVLAAPLALAGGRLKLRPPLALVAAVAIALASTGVLISKRAQLLPFGGATAGPTSVPSQLQSASAAVQANLYTTKVAPLVVAGYTAALTSAGTINGDATLDGPTRARELTEQVVQPLRTLRSVVTAYQATAPAVQETNAIAVNALDGTIRAFEDMAEAFDTNDATGLAAVSKTVTAAQALWGRWAEQVAQLK